MKIIATNLRRVDAFQQRHRVTAFVFALGKKHSDDNGGNLTVQLTYSAFVTVFPLLLLLVTILAIVLVNHPAERAALLSSTYAQFPVIGKQLVTNIHVLRRGSGFGLSVGIVGLVYGSTGLAQSGLYAMAQVWNIPPSHRPSYLARLGRSISFLLVLGTGLGVTTALSGFGTFGQHNVALGLLGELLAVVTNIALYLAAFRILTPKPVQTSWLLPGSICGGAIWTVLQALGGYIVGHDLRGSSAVYGTFGLVLGLLAWIYLGAEITLYAAEINPVVVRHLWPRALVKPPTTKADRDALALQLGQAPIGPDPEIATGTIDQTGKAGQLPEHSNNDGALGETAQIAVKRDHPQAERVERADDNAAEI